MDYVLIICLLVGVFVCIIGAFVCVILWKAMFSKRVLQLNQDLVDYAEDLIHYGYSVEECVKEIEAFRIILSRGSGVTPILLLPSKRVLSTAVYKMSLNDSPLCASKWKETLDSFDHYCDTQ